MRKLNQLGLHKRYEFIPTETFIYVRIGEDMPTRTICDVSDPSKVFAVRDFLTLTKFARTETDLKRGEHCFLRLHKRIRRVMTVRDKRIKAYKPHKNRLLQAAPRYEDILRKINLVEFHDKMEKLLSPQERFILFARSFMSMSRLCKTASMWGHEIGIIQSKALAKIWKSIESLPDKNTVTEIDPEND